MAHSTPEQLIALRQKAQQHIEIGACYYHYRNPEKLYKIVALGLDEATEQPCVIYQSLDSDALVWIRPLSSWLEYVAYNNTQVPRFSKILNK